jgi:hypothetical protein
MSSKKYRLTIITLEGDTGRVEAELGMACFQKTSGVEDFTVETAR